MIRKCFATLAMAMLIVAVGMFVVGCAPDEPAPTPPPELPQMDPPEDPPEEPEERPEPEEPAIPLPDPQ